jgi:hypothetical protein
VSWRVRARVRRGKQRGAEGDLDGGLPGDGDEAKRLDSEGDGDVDHGGRLGLHVVAAFRCSAGDGDRWRRCGSTRWISWRRSLGLKFDGDNESAEETPAARLGAARRKTMQATGDNRGSRARTRGARQRFYKGRTACRV